MHRQALLEELTAGCSPQTAEKIAAFWPDEEREDWILPDPWLRRRVLREFDNAPAYQCGMLVELLTSASNPKRADRIHPAFSSMIPQLSEEDCEILRDLAARPIAVLDCLAGLVTTQKSGLFTRESVTTERVEPLIPLLTARTPKNGDLLTLQVCLENLLRLGLAETQMNSDLREPSQVNDDEAETIFLMYEDMIRQTMESFQNSRPVRRDAVCYLRTGRLVLSGMGRRFVRYCIL